MSAVEVGLTPKEAFQAVFRCDPTDEILVRLLSDGPVQIGAVRG